MSVATEIARNEAEWIVPECASLMARYKRMKLLYATAVDLLFATGYQVGDAEYARLKASVEEARAQLEIVRHALDKHQQIVR